MTMFIVSMVLIPIGGILMERPELLTNHFYHWAFGIPYEDDDSGNEE